MIQTFPPTSAESTSKEVVLGAVGAPRNPVGQKLNLNVKASLLRHKLLALGSFLVVLMTGLAFAWFRGAPTYSASAAIFISPRFVANLNDDKEFDLQSNSQYREYVQQNVRTINRYDIVKSALERIGVERNLWIRPNETLSHATERLQYALKIEPVADTYQVMVSLEGPSKEGLSEVVNAVVDTFLQKSKSEEFFGTDERIQNLREARAQVVREIEDKQKQRAELAGQLGVSTFSDGFPNPYDKLLVDAKSALADARRQRIQAEAQLATLQGFVKEGNGKSLEAYATEMVNKDPRLMSLDTNINQRISALLSTISGLSPSHPGRRAAEKEKRELEEERNTLYRSLLSTYSNMILEQKIGEVSKARKAEVDITRELSKQSAQAFMFSHGYQQAMSLGSDMERERKRLDSIDDRISFLSLESRAPGFVRLFAAARVAGSPVRGGRMRLAFLAGVAALLFGCIVPVGVDYMDPRIYGPGTVRGVLGFPVLGWLLEKADAGKDFEREQVLRLASRLCQDYQTNGSHIFVFTAVKAQNGTTTIVRDLAHALTQLGISALAVEANAYRSDPRYRSPGSRGLSVVLRGESDLASEIVPGTESRSDQLPVGDVNNFGNLQDIQRLVQVLRDATQIYPMILVDLPPILASVDAELIARAADVSILVIEAEAVTKAELRRAAKVLQGSRPAAVSALVNRVKLDAAGGFGRAARDEFYQGAPKPAPRWASPWLWN